MRLLRLLTGIAVLHMLAVPGCGGGGGDGDVASGSTTGPGPDVEVTTYGTTNLPGRLLVNNPSGDTQIFNLRTGQRSALPKLANAKDRWTKGASTDTLLRWQVHADREGEVPVSFFNSNTWTQSRADLPIWASFQSPKLSADGKYILTFWHDGSQGVFSDEKNPLTIFDVATGKPVKRGSMLPEDETVISSPAAWLPDGRYLYLAAEKMYISSPSRTTSDLIATLALPDNSAMQDGDFVSGTSQVVVSPDGKKVAFTWAEPRGTGWDRHIWVVNVDGTGLHRLTQAPSNLTTLSIGYASPTWSPDSAWVAGVIYMDGSVIAPIFPLDQSFPGVPGGITGSTGCGSNPVFVLPASANRVAVSWPQYDVKYGVKVRSASGGSGGQWVSTCGEIAWLP